METKTKITITATVNAPVAKVWDLYTGPQHIVKWNTPSPDWHTTKAETDLKNGGKFLSRMEAKDGSFGFDFVGTYDDVIPNKRLDYTIADGRKVEQLFSEDDGKTHMTIHFEAENQNPVEMQRGGWQAILDSFKQYAEAMQ